MSRRNYLIAIVAILIGGLVLTGSFSGTTGGVWPFYIEKSGTSIGISLAFYTKYLPGSQHLGIDLSGLTQQEANTTINGIGISVNRDTAPPDRSPTIGYATANGLEISFLGATSAPTNGPENAKVFGGPSSKTIKKKVNGIQIGLILEQADGTVFQFGLWLVNEKRASILVNTTIF